jgi:hypothetical protein
MTASRKVPEVSECPAWCTVNHAEGATYHTRCAGEVQWSTASVAVSLARGSQADLAELGYYTDHGAPAIAILSGAEARQLRDYLNSALSDLGAA